MKLTRPSAEIINISAFPLKHIEACGRTCYKSENKITDNSSSDFVQKILDRGHESVLEHASMSVRFICDRGVSHEIVRHRLASYSQESTRYVNYGGKADIEFILPPWISMTDEQIENFNPENIFPEPKAMDSTEFTWLHSCLESERAYKHMVNTCKMSPQLARSVLNHSLKTELVMTANLREWRHFFRIRCDKDAHPQMRELTLPLLEEVHERIPVVFDDLYEEFLNCEIRPELP